MYDMYVCHVCIIYTVEQFSNLEHKILDVFITYNFFIHWPFLIHNFRNTVRSPHNFTRNTYTMSSGPDLKKYMGKMVGLKLNANRQVQGMLAGYDQFMNLVIDDAVQIISSSEQKKLGQIVVRGNSVIRLEHLGKKWAQEQAAK